MTVNEKYISYTRVLAKLTVIHTLPSLSDPSVQRIVEGDDLELAYAFSNGSACNSSSYTPSYVLAEMGLSNKLINEAVRISWSAESNIDFSIFCKCVKSMQ